CGLLGRRRLRRQVGEGHRVPAGPLAGPARLDPRGPDRRLALLGPLPVLLGALGRRLGAYVVVQALDAGAPAVLLSQPVAGAGEGLGAAGGLLAVLHGEPLPPFEPPRPFALTEAANPARARAGARALARRPADPGELRRCGLRQVGDGH